jgi:hypothetical protein
MNDCKIMINDTDKSSYDDLIVEFKKWRSHRRSQYPATHRLAVTGAAQQESLATCRSENRSEIVGVKTEAEVMLALEAADTGTFRWDIRTDTITWDDVLERLFDASGAAQMAKISRPSSALSGPAARFGGFMAAAKQLLKMAVLFT